MRSSSDGISIWQIFDIPERHLWNNKKIDSDNSSAFSSKSYMAKRSKLKNHVSEEVILKLFSKDQSIELIQF